jgi:hypothetical protein
MLMAGVSIICRSEFRGELELLRALAEPEPTFTDVNHFLSEFVTSVVKLRG